MSTEPTSEENKTSNEKNLQNLANTVFIRRMIFHESPRTSEFLKRTVFLPENIDLKCLLLADTEIDCAPVHLRQLMKHYDTSKLPQAELLWLLVYIMALESGFVTQMEHTTMKDVVKIQSTSTFHSKNVRKITRERPSYAHNFDKCQFRMLLLNIVDTKLFNPNALLSVLTALVTGGLMIVTLMPHRWTDACGDSVCLSIGRYVLSGQMSDKPFYSRFRKLDELSSLLSNNLFVRVRNRQLAMLDDIMIYPALDALPAELYDFIFQYLTQKELKIVANTCRRLYALSTSSKYIERVPKRPFFFL